jgi:hypothetical protein
MYVFQVVMLGFTIIWMCSSGKAGKGQTAYSSKDRHRRRLIKITTWQHRSSVSYCYYQMKRNQEGEWQDICSYTFSCPETCSTPSETYRAATAAASMVWGSDCMG